MHGLNTKAGHPSNTIRRGSATQRTVSLPRAPDRRQLDRLASILAPARRITQPRVLGTERIPHRPVLFVGNHSRYALLDLRVMMDGLWSAGESLSARSASMPTTPFRCGVIY